MPRKDLSFFIMTVTDLWCMIKNKAKQQVKQDLLFFCTAVIE